MRILCYILVVLFATTSAVGQQINPVPDYIFRNSMSVGRNAPTDTSAYFSIGPRFGATRGFMPPMVVDTAAVTGTKRNGLLIYSIQRNSFLYWDSTGNRWSRIAANLDTLQLATRAWRQKGIDSVNVNVNARLRISDTATMLSTYARGSGFINRMPKWLNTGNTLTNSNLYDDGSRIGIGTLSPGAEVDIAEALTDGSALLRIQNTATTGTITTANLVLASYDGSGVTVGTAIHELSNTWTNTAFQGGNYPNSSGIGGYKSGGLSLIAGNAAGVIRFYSGGQAGTNERMRLFSNGRFAINTTTDAGYQFDVAGSMRNTTDAYFNTTSGETYIGTTSDAGAFRLQVNGVARASDGLATGAPAGGTAATWKLGTVATVSPTSPNRTIEVEIGGTIYYIHAKTTND